MKVGEERLLSILVFARPRSWKEVTLTCKSVNCKNLIPEKQVREDRILPELT